MIKRYLLVTKKDNMEWNQLFFTMNQAEKEQLVAIKDGYKTKIIPLNIDLARHEIQEHYQDEIEKEDILNDFLYILSDRHDVPEDDFDIIEQDINTIFTIYQKVSDSELSHWQNIERILDYIKDYKDVKYNYSKIK